MGNIPNTNTPNLVLQSVGNGSNDSRWGTSSGGGSTLPTGTGTGQMIWWNGTAWVVTVTPATNKYFYWNGSAWANATVGDATSIQGYPVNITGIGNGDVLYWSNVGSTQQWLTGPTPTGDGQIQYWNTSLSGHWSLSAAATTTGQALVWNNSTLTWGPANITLAGDVTGSAGANTVVNIQNYPVNLTGLGNGDLLYWSNVGTNQWLTGPTPTTTGQYYSWNAGTGAWTLSSAGGGITNDAQYGSNGSGSVTTAAGVNPQGLPSAVFTTAMSGFTKYQITASIGIRSTSATTSYMQIHNGSSLIGIPMAATLSANAVSTITNTIVVSGYSSGTSYSFYIYANVQNGTGTHTGAVITAIGIQ